MFAETGVGNRSRTRIISSDINSAIGRPRFDFGGETAVVAGGSSGIGRVALAFGAAGATVVNAGWHTNDDFLSGDRPLPRQRGSDYVTGAIVYTAAGHASDESNPRIVRGGRTEAFF